MDDTVSLYGVAGMKKGVINKKAYIAHPRAAGKVKYGGKVKKAGKAKASPAAKKVKADAKAAKQHGRILKKVEMRKKKMEKRKTAAAKKIESVNKKAAAAAAKVTKKAAAVVTKGAKQSAAASMKAAKEQAVQQKKADHIAVQKSTQAIKKTDVLQKKAEAVLAKSQNVQAKAAARELLVKIKSTAQAHTTHIASKKGSSLKTSKIVPHFSEGDIESLQTKQFNPGRALTEAERKVDFEYLHQCFNEKQNDLRKTLAEAIAAMLALSLMSMLKKLKYGDVPGIGDLSLVNSNKLNSILNSAAKDAFEEGKSMAAKELKVVRPATPLLKTQLMNLNSSMRAERMATNIDLAAKQEAHDGLVKGLTIMAIIAAATTAAEDAADDEVDYAEGTVIGENINDGRQVVFEDNISDIQAFQRSEILDDRTCEDCIAADEATIYPDDDALDVEEIHPNCRGIWVPITSDEETPAVIGLPAHIQDIFDEVE